MNGEDRSGGKVTIDAKVASEVSVIAACVVNEKANGSRVGTLMSEVLKRSGRGRPRGRRGFTIIELMIAVLIVGILVAVAFPSYQNSIRKANRRHAQAAMMELAQREHQYLMDARSYGTVAQVGYGLPAEVSRFYTINVATSGGPPPSFTITVTPIAGTTQANDGAMTLNHLGAKTPPEKW